jgi:hypothetical protein
VITVKNGLSKKDKRKVSCILADLSDIYRDFYVTKKNLRLFIQDNKNILFNDMKKGDLIAFGEEGIGIITGYSDKSPRKYIKILANTQTNADKLIKCLLWNVKCDLWAKVKANSFLRLALENNNFRYYKYRGREILLFRNKYCFPPIEPKENFITRGEPGW